jgi:hypothetical protein
MSEQDISTESTRAIPRVFISYSHDSPEHSERVLSLAWALQGPHHLLQLLVPDCP